MGDRASAALVALVVVLGLAAAVSLLMLAAQTPSPQATDNSDDPHTAVELVRSDDRIRVRHQAGPPMELREIRLERVGEEIEVCRSDGACTPTTEIKVGGSGVADCRPSGEEPTRIWVRGELIDETTIACAQEGGP